MKSLAQAYLDVSMFLPIDDIKVKQRLDRAYDIVRAIETGSGYSIVSWSGQYSQPSMNLKRESTSLLEDNSVIYTVNSEHCTCPDYESARGNLCKHRITFLILSDMGRMT